jgi:thioesterase domain-containing protein/acyl carrier protein
MVPAAYVLLESFPRTPNGKLDRRSLPAPEADAYVRRIYKAPMGEIEATIAAIWKDLFHVAKIGRRDHFFELGGHSILAIQFVSRLRQTLGIDVPIRQLFAEPTVAGLAASLLKDNQTLLHRNLVPIRAQGRMRPLFLIHAIGGSVNYVRELAPWLDADVPVYGLAASGLLDGEEPLRSVEEMAARYVQAIRQVQPQGPYALAGYSAGGVIAYEVANQLVGADETVAFLGLIDASSPDVPVMADPETLDDVAFLLEHCERAVHKSSMSAIIDELRALARAGDMEAMLARLQQATLIPTIIENAAMRRHISMVKVIETALARYCLPPIPVPLTLYVSTEREPIDGQDPTTDPVERGARGWKKLAGHRLTIIPLGGNHISLMSPPHIQQLGREISKALSAAAGNVEPYIELDHSPVVTIHTGDSDTCPLFCVPGAGASVTAFCGLAEVLETTQPVYGLQPRGLETALVPHMDVPAAARSYLRALRAMWPHGPYQLLGHSFGGWIAFEMARQLVATGDSVSALIVLDSDAPLLEGQTKERVARIPLLLRLVELFEMSARRSLLLTEADFAPLSHDRQLALLLERLVAVKLMPPRTDLQVLRNLLRVFAANSGTSYVPEGIYDGALHFVCVEDPSRTQPVIDGWRRWAPNTTSWRCPGDHMTMLTSPHVETLAAWLRPLLQEPRMHRTRPNQRGRHHANSR